MAGAIVIIGTHVWKSRTVMIADVTDTLLRVAKHVLHVVPHIHAILLLLTVGYGTKFLRDGYIMPDWCSGITVHLLREL